MGILNWWSRVRIELHTLEHKTCTGSRLAHTPPEFWTPKDWFESHRRRLFIEDEMRRGQTKLQAMLFAHDKFPRRPFWPETPERDGALMQACFEGRSWLAMLSYVALEPHEAFV